VVVAVVVLIALGEILTLGSIILFRSERPPAGTDQRGYWGTGLVQVDNPTTREEMVGADRVPASVPYAGDKGERAGNVYENVQVLGDVSTGEFTSLMVNMTEWVAPAQGCAACHNAANFAEDMLYTRVVARPMLQMVKHVNANWTQHVAKTGVTCCTCHRGNLVPRNVCFSDPGPKQAAGFARCGRARTIRRRRSWAAIRCRSTRSRHSSNTTTTSASSPPPPCPRAICIRSSRPSGSTR
jgi:photosynthetic reaction center cytochrome c subunit